MQHIKSITTQLFVTLGAIFLILVFVGIYFFVADPYGIRPLLFGGGSVPTQTNSASVSGSGAEGNADTNTNMAGGSTSTESSAAAEGGASGGFELSGGQVDALTSLGIDPADVPASISAEQEACFAGVLGEARVGEIKAGAVPSTFEFFKAKSCI